jgi:hypothetical protein
MPFETYVDGTGAGRQRLSYYEDMDVYIYRGCVQLLLLLLHGLGGAEARWVASNVQAAHLDSPRDTFTA